MVKLHTLPTAKPHTDKATKSGQKGQMTSLAKLQMGRFAKSAFGLVLLVMSASVFVQVIPLVYIFIGGLLGLPADAKLNTMDGGIWVLTCVTTMLIAVYGFIAWSKYVWNRFVRFEPTKS